MRVLYTNPVFSDYRIPFYEELNKLFDGEFYVMYSPLRYTMVKQEHVLPKIKERIGNFSYEYNGEIVKLVKKPFNKDFDSYYRFPIMHDFFKSLSKYNPDILITEGFFQWTPMVVWYAWRHKLPVYIGYERTAHTERFAPKLKIWERKFIDKFVTGYFANGTETKQYLESIGIKSEKIYIAGMNADSQGLRKGVASVTVAEKLKKRAEINISNDGLVYLYSGQFIPRKGVKYLLDGWKEHIKHYTRDSLVLIGGGELLEEYIQTYGEEKSIHFMGKVPYDDVYKYYAISDVFVIPTLEDNWCLVVPEAMSVGMPVVCSKYNGGACDLIRDGENGTIFDPLDSNSMTKALCFFHNKDLKAMGKRSIELEEPWNTENCAKRLYNTIIVNHNIKKT